MQIFLFVAKNSLRSPLQKKNHYNKLLFISVIPIKFPYFSFFLFWFCSSSERNNVWVSPVHYYKNYLFPSPKTSSYARRETTSHVLCSFNYSPLTERPGAEFVPSITDGSRRLYTELSYQYSWAHVIRNPPGQLQTRRRLDTCKW